MHLKNATGSRLSKMRKFPMINSKATTIRFTPSAARMAGSTNFMITASRKSMKKSSKNFLMKDQVEEKRGSLQHGVTVTCIFRPSMKSTCAKSTTLWSGTAGKVIRGNLSEH